ASAYHEKLRADYRAALHTTGVPESNKIYEYGVTFNGFAARLTATQAARLARADDVAKIWKNEVVRADTVSTPAFLGIDGPDGVWAQRFGGDARAGEGIIVGVVDTGFWPENPSFAALPEPRPDRAVIAAKWHGTCDAGADPVVAHRITCNNKVIGARYFYSDGIQAGVPDEFGSPRDRNGHGSHTASMAAGDHGVPAVVHGIPMGRASGMAPAARIAVYKALWHQPDGGRGNSADLVAAIDAAVGDGVDVINYSISGSQESIVDAAEIAFLNAAAAGVFIAASAGNTAGPGTVAHNSPWVTTVAASTHDRAYGKSVRLGNGVTYTGVGVAPEPVGPTGLVDAAAAGSELCLPGALDPARVAGKIVLCKRGTNPRVEKSAAVKAAGGVGMVLYDSPDAGLTADFHAVPSVHLNNADGLAVKAYAADPDATASLSAGFHPRVRAPAMAGFSSSGPAQASADLLKPDIAAPGVDVIAAYSPLNAGGSDYEQISGTSMAAPHLAGIAALLRSKHPDWSPMAVKSALMTAARPVGGDYTPLNYGAGQVEPAGAFDPGLVYDSDALDWFRYGCGLGQFQLVYGPAACQAVGTM
ncbi:MAG TPA: S8 family peptidase, partial [Micromonosporaceae bacterium]|nr:S8 family peptidase [Micromonosporaceae bacterium]